MKKEVMSPATPDSSPNLPRHVAIIMDGNGRWAVERGLERTEGHVRGSEATRRIVAEGRRLGVGVMTLYSFSVENWKRPKEEVGFLMELFCRRLGEELGDLMKNGVRLVHVGRREGLPERVLRELDAAVEHTSRNEGMTLALAWNYGARSEMVDAVRAIAEKVKRGELPPELISEETIASHLYTAGLPDPDLVIRTGGEMRLSNFLLWQASYAEFWVTPTLWPDFSEEEFRKALEEYTSRKRRFGDVNRGQSS